MLNTQLLGLQSPDEASYRVPLTEVTKAKGPKPERGPSTAKTSKLPGDQTKTVICRLDPFQSTTVALSLPHHQSKPRSSSVGDSMVINAFETRKQGLAHMVLQVPIVSWCMLT